MNKTKIQWTDDLIEKMASLEHERWSSWLKYQFECCRIRLEDDTWIIPKERVKRWQYLMNCSYADLTEECKEDDRIEVRKTIELINRSVKEQE